MTYKKWYFQSFTLLFLIATGLITFNFIIDPLQFYRTAEWYPPQYSTNQRYQNPGLARNLEYNTIIAGTSMTENIRPVDVKNVWPERKAVKLSISGSSIFEQKLIIEVAVENQESLENVIWGLDYFSLRGESDRVRDDFGSFPFYLYDENVLNDIRYLLNIDTLKDSWKFSLGEQLEASDLEKLKYWGDKFEFNEDITIKNFKEKTLNSTTDPEEYKLEYIKKNIETNVISVIAKNPDIQFDLFFPPYSFLFHTYYAVRYDELFKREIETRELIADMVASYPNVRLHDFQVERKVIMNLGLYKDPEHHNPMISRWTLEEMKKGAYVVKDIRENNRELEKIVLESMPDVKALMQK